MRPPVVLVMAKAPVPGRVKTRLAAHVGHESAASLASLALLDTLDVCEEAFGPERCHLALAGDLGDAVGGRELRRRLASWQVRGQHGRTFGERLSRAHQETFRAAAAAVVQVGMDTPHMSAGALVGAADLLSRASGAVLGPACDGGWWLLGAADPRHLSGLAGVPMSTGATGARTRAMLRKAGAAVADVELLHDIDTAQDAAHVARAGPALRFSRAWSAWEACASRSVGGPA